MFRLCLLLLAAAAAASSESVRETETWMPMKVTQTVAMSTLPDDLELSGDTQNGSDFGFTDDEDDYYIDSLYDDEDEPEGEEFSGSGGGEKMAVPGQELRPSVKPGVNDNKIPEVRRPARPTTPLDDVVHRNNDIQLVRNGAESVEEYPSNVLMSHASDDSLLKKTEVLAALIAAGAVGLMFAVLLVLFLIYRVKKKDEGSYDLGKKPIYKKAPTTEIYA
ncbi:syndecan-4 isoform 2-T2 [Aulostomus maculatus]